MFKYILSMFLLTFSKQSPVWTQMFSTILPDAVRHPKKNKTALLCLKFLNIDSIPLLLKSVIRYECISSIIVC